MKKYICPICEAKIELADGTKTGTRVTCPSCFAQLALRQHHHKLVLTCPTCKEELFDLENCEDCETRRAKKKLLEEGRL